MKKKIIFTLPAEAVAEATEGLLLGDFNDWKPEEGVVMKKQKDGSLKTSIELETGKSYQYRYLLNDGRWENDYNAQEYVFADGYSVDNCLITIPKKTEEAKKTKTVKPSGSKETKVKATAGTKVKDSKSATTKAKTAKAKVIPVKAVKEKE